MAISLNSMACSSYLHPNTEGPQTHLSSASKVYVGLRLQSPNSFGFANRNLNVSFQQKVHKSIQSRPSNTPKRGRIAMMPIGTPRVPYKVPGGREWYWVDLWNALYRERIIFLGGFIDEAMSNQLLGTMLYLDSLDETHEESKRMYFYIKCLGGDLTPVMSIYDTMQTLQSSVATHCLGSAYGMAAYILAAGEKGRRSATPLAFIQLDAPAGSGQGQADDVQNEANELLRVRDYLFKELAKQTGQPFERILEDLMERKNFSADEALEYGIIDRVVRPRPITEDAETEEA